MKPQRVNKRQPSRYHSNLTSKGWDFEWDRTTKTYVYNHSTGKRITREQADAWGDFLSGIK